ncbi:hypothetical protein ACIBG8_30445 [Nonomuraea sp. NPDC050556]|uniref:hypothetical protein n=1 Tax=Nonomuraea sp. NPDC050556 TaxID=3364369 RepID=UPI0037A2C5CA
MIQPTTVPPPIEKPFRRVVLAGLVGVLLPAGLLGWSFLMATLFPDSSRCGEYTGCLGFLVDAWEVGRWVAVVLAWPLLHLLRVRPAWPVALLAALFLAAIWQLAQAPWVPRFDAFALIVVSGPLAYPLAALLSATRILWPWRALFGVLLLGLYLLTLFAWILA